MRGVGRVAPLDRKAKKDSERVSSVKMPASKAGCSFACVFVCVCECECVHINYCRRVYGVC